MSDKPLKVLVVGSGGREHALVKACLASPLVAEVVAAPGNGGIASEVPCLPVDVSDPQAIAALAKSEKIDFAIIGPEVPLCAGAVDALGEAGILAYGPSKEAARLEASKAFTKDFLARHSIPTAASETFTDKEAALKHLRGRGAPVVVKASGLAAGKGVIVAQTLEEAEAAVVDMLENDRFGESGREVVIEDFLRGEEASIHAIVSGGEYVLLPPSQDHKPIGEGDTGPNTGGMGAYAPADVVSGAMHGRVVSEIVEPTVKAFVKDGVDYRGTLFIGIMVTPEGPKVLEFNVRFGDPETQVLLPLLETDPVALMLDCARGELKPGEARLRDGFGVIVVLAAEGYPDDYPKGETISLPATLEEGTQVVHAGTRLDEGGRIVTNGGRVLGVTAMAGTLGAAVEKAYRLCGNIGWDHMYYRRDIASKQLNRH